MVVELHGRFFLVKTRLSDSNEFAGPKLYLGSWCLDGLNDEKRDQKIMAPYHWDDRDKLFRDFCYSENLYHEILLSLCRDLNEYHKLDYSSRNWEIILGPWLKVLIGVLLDRYEVLKSIQNAGREVFVKNIIREQSSTIPFDTQIFFSWIEEDYFNETVFSELVEKVFAHKFGIQNTFSFVPVKKKWNLRSKVKRFLNNPFLYVKNIFVNIIQVSLDRLVVSLISQNILNSEIFLYKTYLARISESKLEKLLHLHNTRFNKFNVKCTCLEYDNVFRIKYVRDSYENLNDFTLYYVYQNIPKVFLEAYVSVNNLLNDLILPKNPKVIFTSNAHFIDDIFKIWASSKVSKGCRLIIGQHGGNYGMAKFNFSENHELSISDLYLTWGWSNCSKTLPFFNLKLQNTNFIRNPENNILVVLYAEPRFSYFLYASPKAGQYSNYIDNQLDFLSNLSKENRDRTHIRLYRTDYGWNVKSRISSFHPKVKYDDELQSLSDSLKKCKLFVSTYNATTYLESIFYNVPTIIFFDTKLWELREFAESDFLDLEAVGVFHRSSASAARFINLNFDKIDRWWSSAGVRIAITYFMFKYSRTDLEGVDKLGLLLELEKQRNV
jgi:putative transferase (TIGR04331 family)